MEPTNNYAPERIYNLSLSEVDSDDVLNRIEKELTKTKFNNFFGKITQTTKKLKISTEINGNPLKCSMKLSKEYKLRTQRNMHSF